MKRVLFILLMFTTSSVFSQTWKKNLPQAKSEKEFTFLDYQKAFNDYWKPYNVKNGYYMANGVKRKAPGWKQFKRWEYNMEGQINPSTGELPKVTAQEAYEKYLKSNKASKSKNANWTCLGTNSSNGGYAGIGRISCVAFHPNDNNTYWVGAAAGGLWKTTNNGSSWTCLTNDNGVLAISDIVIPSDYATSNTIYIATGDKDAWDNRSIGVLKTTNGGTTWNTTGLSFSISTRNMVNRLLLDPNDDNTIIAATSDGVYKTTNGGTSWSTKLSSTDFIDMEYKPNDYSTLYGSTKEGGVYVSSNSGGNWSKTLNVYSSGRVEIAVTADEPSYVYAVVAASNNGLEGVYKSTNSGASFSKKLSGTTTNLLGWEADGSDSKGQGWYDLSLAVSPSNANILLVGGINTWKSTNGGSSWSISSHWYGGGGAAEVHADKHQLKYRSNGDLFECNDGGIYISTNNGYSWTDKSDGLTISQIYKLSNSATVSTEVITGLQDNGTKLLSGGSWSDVKGGDGMECLIDYTDVNIQYGTYTNGQITRTTDHWNNTTDIEPIVNGEALEGAWVTPYIIDPENHNTLYAGYADVYKTTNKGNSWTKISTMNTSDNLRAMAISESNTDYLYVSDRSNIWKTTNGGSSWSDITGSLPTYYGNITYIAVKNDDPNTVWITLSGYNSNAVYQTTNGGTSWTNISEGLPEIPAYSIVQNKQSTSEVQLYVGTELGIYFKKGTDNWVPYNTNLPNVRIGEIEIYYASNPSESKLRAATYGRGLWETPVYTNSVVNTYTITATASPTEGGTITGAGSFNSGEQVSLKVTANAGYSFVNWTESNSPVSTNATFTFNAESNRTLIANFEANVNTYTITASANPTQGGTITGAGSFNQGEAVSLVATANTGYSFVNWTENNSAVSTNATFTFNAESNRTLVANFEANVNTYTITASANPTEGGTITGTGDFTHGDNVSLIATANTDYTFVNWTEEGIEVSNTTTFSFIAEKDRTLVANFNSNANLSEIKENGISIYPNPTQGFINFNFAKKNIVRLSILDITGKLIIEKTNLKQEATIDISNMANGVYIINIQTDKEVFATKIIKE